MMEFFYALFKRRGSKPKKGRWKEFNKYGNLISVGNYASGKKHGHWQEYYDSGELMFEEHYQHGVPHGRYASYHVNGSILSEGFYAQGRREGYFNVYDETGRLVKSLLFIDNRLVEEETEIRIEEPCNIKNIKRSQLLITR